MLGLLLLSQLRHAGAHDPVRVTATRGGLSGNAHSPRLEVRLCADHPLLGSRAAAAAAETTAEPCAGLNLALCAVRTGSDSQTKGCRPAFEPPRLTVFSALSFSALGNTASPLSSPVIQRRARGNDVLASNTQCDTRCSQPATRGPPSDCSPLPMQRECESPRTPSQHPRVAEHTTGGIFSMLSSAGLPTTSTLSLPFALCETFSEAPPLASAPMFGCKVSREGGGEGGFTHRRDRPARERAGGHSLHALG